MKLIASEAKARAGIVGFNLFVFEVRLETKHEIHLSFLKQFLHRPADDVKYSRQHLLEVVDLCKTEFSVL